MNRRQAILGTVAAVVGSQLPGVEAGPWQISLIPPEPKKVACTALNVELMEGFVMYTDGTMRELTKEEAEHECELLLASI